MFFKFHILLLCFIIAASCTKTDSKTKAKLKKEAKIIEDSFKDCLKYITEDLRYQSEITMGHCLLYMGKNIESYNIITKYFEEHTEIHDAKIDLKPYCELFKHFCNMKKLTVQECAKEWKDERIIEDSFNDCSKWFINSRGYQTTKLKMSHFTKYMGETDDNLKIINDYFGEHTEKRREDYDIINLERYREIFKHHCNRKKLDIQECAEDRKNAIMVDSFKDCFRWLKWKYQGLDLVDHITADQFMGYMVINHDDDIKIIDKYFEEHPKAKSKKQKINLQLYSKLFKYYCETNYPEYTMERCAGSRKTCCTEI